MKHDRCVSRSSMNFFYHEFFGSTGQSKAAVKHIAWNYQNLNRNAATVSIVFLKL
jgi:hypothetical protein